jgi:CRISPR-associated protein Cas5t
MLGLQVTVPVACFRKGFAREYWETEELPPPATCYGFLLSLVGETDRRRHIGVRVCPALLSRAGSSFPDDSRGLDGAVAFSPPERSTVLRTLWRVKDRATPQGVGTNARPDYQELLTDVRLAIWLDSRQETGGTRTLEQRVIIALDHPEQINRFGGLCLGESTHLVDEVTRLERRPDQSARAFLLADRGRLSLPVWVDHVGSAGTRYATGNLDEIRTSHPPKVDRMPKIHPGE